MPDLSFELIKSIYKKYPNWSRFLLLLILVIPLFFIGCYLLGDYGFVLIRTSLSIDGLLAYYGGFLAFIGTTILGLVTITQTQKANEETDKANRRMIELTERQLEESRDVERARFQIREVLFKQNTEIFKFSNNIGKYSITISKTIYSNSKIDITLLNLSNSYALNFNFHSDITAGDFRQKNINLIPKAQTHITIYFDKILRCLGIYGQHNFKIHMTYENIYNVPYCQEINLCVKETSDSYTIEIDKHMPMERKTEP